MREKMSALVATGMALSADLIAHPGHGPGELQSTAWHWLLEPAHAVVTTAALAGVCGLVWLTNRLKRRDGRFGARRFGASAVAYR